MRTINDILNEPKFKNIISVSKQHTQSNDPAHDFSHVLRVLKNGIEIASKEDGDIEIIACASFLHDICNFPKNHPLRKLSSEKSSLMAEEILKKEGFEPKKIELIKDGLHAERLIQQDTIKIKDLVLDWFKNTL